MLHLSPVGHTKNVEHVYRNLSLYCSPPEGLFVLDGGGCQLKGLTEELEEEEVEAFVKLDLSGALLADALLSGTSPLGANLLPATPFYPGARTRPPVP